MSNSIKLRTQAIDGLTELKILLTHPMENGRNRDPATGELIPAHFIETLHINVNDQTVIRADMAGSISQNPFFSFRLRNCQPGDHISVQWVDNLDGNDHTDIVIETV